MLAVFPCIGKSTIEESMVTGMGGMHARMVHIHAGRSARTILPKKHDLNVYISLHLSRSMISCVYICTLMFTPLHVVGDAQTNVAER